ncbi:hypothetical protein, partial [Pandoraea sputorum]|uniref:hypothetical protein n=1 Tax=Pandoraea sputorum TaxID=93222 RepID=UPI003557CA3E
MSHQQQLGTQQANTLSTLLHGCRCAAAVADVRTHLNPMTVPGLGRLKACSEGSLEALLAGVTLIKGALHHSLIRCHG